MKAAKQYQSAVMWQLMANQSVMKISIEEMANVINGSKARNSAKQLWLAAAYLAAAQRRAKYQRSVYQGEAVNEVSVMATVLKYRQ